jgi:hypothetical protein
MKLFLVLTLSLVTQLSFAKEGKHGKGNKECREDKQKLCKDVEKGDGKIRDCLFKNLSSISNNACRVKIEKWKKVYDACHGDREKLCPGMKKHELRECMKKNRDKISQTCKDIRKELKGKKLEEAESAED